MPLKLDDVIAVIQSSTPEIVQADDGTLRLVFNPHSDNSFPTDQTPPLAIHFDLTQAMDGVGGIGFAQGMSISLASRVPEYAAKHMKSVSLNFSDITPMLSLEFFEDDNEEALYFMRALTEMAGQMGGLHVDTENNVLKISGNPRSIDDLIFKLEDVSVETFLNRRADNQIAPDAPGEDVVVPLFK